MKRSVVLPFVALTLLTACGAPEEEAEVFQPFADHLAEALADQGVVAGEVVGTDTAEEMAELVERGEVDLYIDSMFGVTTVVGSGVGTPLLRRWKDGEPTYHSIVVARADSGIATPASWWATRSPSRRTRPPTATSSPWPRWPSRASSSRRWPIRTRRSRATRSATCSPATTRTPCSWCWTGGWTPAR